MLRSVILTSEAEPSIFSTQLIPVYAIAKTADGAALPMR